MKRKIKKILLIIIIVFVSFFMLVIMVETNSTLNYMVSKFSFELDKSFYHRVNYCESMFLTNKFDEKRSFCASIFEDDKINHELQRVIKVSVKISKYTTKVDIAYDYLVIDWLFSNLSIASIDKPFTNDEIISSIRRIRALENAALFIVILSSEKMLNVYSMDNVIQSLELLIQNTVFETLNRYEKYSIYQLVHTIYIVREDRLKADEIGKKIIELAKQQ